MSYYRRSYGNKKGDVGNQLSDNIYKESSVPSQGLAGEGPSQGATQSFARPSDPSDPSKPSDESIQDKTDSMIPSGNTGKKTGMGMDSKAMHNFNIFFTIFVLLVCLYLLYIVVVEGRKSPPGLVGTPNYDIGNAFKIADMK